MHSPNLAPSFELAFVDLWPGRPRIPHPLAVWGLAQVLFRDNSDGSLITDKDGKVIGSRLIGQSFADANRPGRVDGIAAVAQHHREQADALLLEDMPGGVDADPRRVRDGQNHRRQLASTNLLENLMRRLKKRTAVVCVFPNRASCERLVGAQLIEVHEGWQAEPRAYLSTPQAPGAAAVVAGVV
jgi:hypothetical protein